MRLVFLYLFCTDDFVEPVIQNELPLNTIPQKGLSGKQFSIQLWEQSVLLTVALVLEFFFAKQNPSIF